MKEAYCHYILLYLSCATLTWHIGSSNTRHQNAGANVVQYDYFERDVAREDLGAVFDSPRRAIYTGVRRMLSPI